MTAPTRRAATYILFVDDDAFLNPEGVLDRYEAAFAAIPNVAIVTARHIDHDTRRHAARLLPAHRQVAAARTSRSRRSASRATASPCAAARLEAIGPMSEDFFYGLEEIDYAYRVVDAGYEIYYEPGCWVVEHNDPGGASRRRRSRRCG